MSHTSFTPGDALHDVASPGHWRILARLVDDEDIYAVTHHEANDGHVFRARAWPDGVLNVQGRLIHPREAEPGMRLITRADGATSSDLIHRVTLHLDCRGISIDSATTTTAYRDDQNPRIEVTLPASHEQARPFPGPAVHRDPPARQPATTPAGE